ncbi:hypothetical protein CSUI_010976, partial [Cystoisospora suis]
HLYPPDQIRCFCFVFSHNQPRRVFFLMLWVGPEHDAPTWSSLDPLRPFW